MGLNFINSIAIRALELVTAAANKIPYFTSASAASTLDFLDEDTMSSDSATGLASQQSIKAYVDTQDALGDDLVEDLSPQLGAQLDVNGFALGDGTLELLDFTEIASAVNHVGITNAITAVAPIVGAEGDDTDIDLNIVSKGTGGIVLNGSTAKVDTILDEDDLVSDDANAIATQQSIKRYVDGISGTIVFDPGSLVDGAGETSSSVTVTGAALGDFAIVAAPYDLQGITATVYVDAANSAKIRLQNETTGTIDLASGTWKVKVLDR